MSSTHFDQLLKTQATMNDVKCLISVSMAALDRVEDCLTGDEIDEKGAFESLYGAWSILRNCYDKLDEMLSMSEIEDKNTINSK